MFFFFAYVSVNKMYFNGGGKVCISTDGWEINIYIFFKHLIFSLFQTCFIFTPKLIAYTS